MWFSLELASAVAGSVSESRDVVSDLSNTEKQSFLRWGQLTSGDIPLVHTHTHRHTDEHNIRIVIASI